MYEERRNRLSLRDIILIVLLMVLFIFVMVWLFPTKGYLEQNNAIVDNEIYNNYLENMSTVAKDYFINSKMPTELGDTVKLTLSEMLEKKLIVEIGGNTSCDLQKSFIEVTKMEEDFQLRVELSCTEYYDYKIITLGCKDYCNLDCNTSNNTTVTKPTQQSTKKYTVTFDSNGGSSVASQKVVSGKTATKPVNPTKEGYTFVEWTLNGKAYNFATPVKSNITLVATWKTNVVEEKPEVVTEYLYIKTINTTTSSWSNWSATQRVWDNYNFKNTTTKEYKLIKEGTETSTQEGVVDSKKAITTTTKKQESAKLAYMDSKLEWVYVGLEYSETPLRPTANGNVKYEKQGIETVSADCYDCSDITYYVYKKYEQKETPITMYQCPSTGLTSEDPNMPCYKTVTVQINPTCNSYGSEYKLEGGACVKYGTITTGRTYYDYQYRTLSEKASAETDEKYSNSDNDTNLISQGYKLSKVCTTTNGNRTCK